MKEPIKVLVIAENGNRLQEITALLPWEKYGVTIGACTCSGLQGVELAVKLAPDIVLTAIRTQDVNGIEVLRQLRAAGQQAHVILLDNYVEFSFLQQALRYGASDYLVRPLEAETLLLSLRRCGTRRHPAKDRVEQELLDFFHRAGIVDGERKVALCTDAAVDLEKEFSCPALRQGNLCYGVAAVPLEQEKAWDRLLAQSRIHIGVSHPFHDAWDLKSALDQARLAASPFWSSEPKVVRECSAMNYEACRLLSQLWGLLHQCQMEQYSWHQFWALYDILLANLQSLQVDFRQIIVIFNSLVVMARSIHPTAGQQLGYLSLQEIDQWAEEGKNLGYALVQIRRDLQESLKATKYDPASHPFGELANEVLIYLDAHFCDPDISVESVAAKFFISPAYFGQTFKRAYGISIREHINRKRADYAEYLLTHEDLPVKEVARRVGISDNFYFSKLFKKYKHMTPGEARIAPGEDKKKKTGL